MLPQQPDSNRITQSITHHTWQPARQSVHVKYIMTVCSFHEHLLLLEIWELPRHYQAICIFLGQDAQHIGNITTYVYVSFAIRYERWNTSEWKCSSFQFDLYHCSRPDVPTTMSVHKKTVSCARELCITRQDLVIMPTALSRFNALHNSWRIDSESCQWSRQCSPLPAANHNEEKKAKMPTFDMWYETTSVAVIWLWKLGGDIPYHNRNIIEIHIKCPVK